MAYRECPNHGWLETAEYGVSPGGETMCPICEVPVTGYYEDVRTRHKFGDIGGPTHEPRSEWMAASREFQSRLEDMDGEYQDEHPVMEDYEL